MSFLKILIICCVMALLPITANAIDSPITGNAESPTDKPGSPLSWRGYIFGEDVSNFDGGIKRGSILTAATRVTALYDTQKASWWKGGQFAAGVLGITQTHNQTLYTGAIQTPSNDNGVPEIRFTDLAYQQTFSDYFMARAGIMDFADYFNIFDVGLTLFNSAFCNTISLSANIQLATYPYPGFGAITQIGNEKLGLLAGVFQGNPQHQSTVFSRGQFIVGEVFTRFGGKGKYDANYTIKAAYWDCQQNLTYVGTTDHGVYVIAEAIWLLPAGPSLAAGLNLGVNPKVIETVTDSVAAVFTITGLIPSRTKDIINLGCGHVWTNGRPHPETMFEVGYTIQLNSRLALTPDLQYFIHPGGDLPNAWVGIIRLQYTLPGTLI